MSFRIDPDRPIRKNLRLVRPGLAAEYRSASADLLADGARV